MGFFSNIFNNTDTIRRQPRPDRINIVATYEDIVEVEFYCMILDFQIDNQLIERIKAKEISRSELKKIFIMRGERINDGYINEYMKKLAPKLNEGDLFLAIDIDSENSYDIQYDFFFE